MTHSSLTFPLFLSFVFISQQQQSCPIGRLSSDRQKCLFALSTTKNFFDAENECKNKALNVGIGVERAFLVSISTAFENANILG